RAGVDRQPGGGLRDRDGPLPLAIPEDQRAGEVGRDRQPVGRGDVRGGQRGGAAQRDRRHLADAAGRVVARLLQRGHDGGGGGVRVEPALAHAGRGDRAAAAGRVERVGGVTRRAVEGGGQRRHRRAHLPGLDGDGEG